MSEQPTSERPRRFRRLRRFIIGCLCFSLIIGSLYGAWCVHLRQRLDAEYAHIRAQGYPITAEELTEWYAKTPTTMEGSFLYELAFDSYASLVDDPIDLLEYNWSTSTFDSLEDVEQDAEEIIRKFVEANATAFTLLHEAAAKGSTRFDLRFVSGSIIGTEFPHLSEVRDAVRNLKWEVVVHILENDPAAALDTFKAMGQTAESVAHEPLIFSQLVRLACHGIKFTATHFAVNNAALSDDQLLGWSDQLIATAPPPDAFIKAFLGERCLYIELFDEPFLPRTFADPTTRFSERLLEGSSKYLDRAVASTGFYDTDRLAYLDSLDRMIDLMPTSYVGRRKEWAQIVEDAEHLSSLRHAFTKSMIPTYARTHVVVARAEAEINLQLTAIAIERFRLANDLLPATLDKLVPTFLESVPIDPFTGESVIYLPSDEGYKVYSIGMNEVDDGGVKEPSGRDGDMVFQVMR